ncbi:MAG: cysteine--tRNA ligase [Candidatus Margulisbacteria bacterium]|nr:cysteine--tRNA ligase [Candidatus Margulisiibacteriota bacterium]
MLKVYNTLTHQKEILKPLHGKEIKMYVCGVTVYDLCHIGHARAYIVFDVIRRYLLYRGYKVLYVQNFTDVDDKILNRALERKINPLQLSQDMIKEYFTDMDRLNIKRAEIYPKVTGHIPDIIEFIKQLIKKGYAYQAGHDVYFDVDKFKEYGKLSKRQADDMQAGARIEINEKKVNPLDFALWKGDEKSELTWESPWGKGRPGWHIECSAMSRKYLGDTFDIHGGGHDLVFPHHENEIAQSEALTGKPMANYWVHNGFVRINSEKMSKSLGNFFTIRDVLAKIDPVVLRAFFLMTHYRMPINYAEEDIRDVETAISRVRHSLENLTLSSSKNVTTKQINELREEFIEGMDDDFNTARGMAVMFQVLKEFNKNPDTKLLALLKELMHVLGLDIKPLEHEPVPTAIKEMAEQRWQARQQKEWQKSDDLRNSLKEAGYLVEDGKDGYKLTKLDA